MLSPHFAEDEFACRCGCGEVRVHPLTLEAAEKLRAVVGRPVYILSGCRCWSHNKAVGGSPRSQHLIEFRDNTNGRLTLKPRPCKAFDTYIAGMSPRQTFRAMLQVEPLKEGGIGVYQEQGFCHGDTRGYKARWYFKARNGKATGLPGNIYSKGGSWI